jgi:2-polyprenyl-3-methyl-5-hydroxy-6-metoxy-1,4-benzoquinol methylase
VSLSERAQRERRHDRHLIDVGAEAAWGWTSPAGRRRAARRAHLIATAAGLRPGMTVLELGCGTGVFTERFAKTGVRLVAIDVSDELIAAARRRTGASAHVDFLCQEFETMHAGQRFDAILGSSVLHHLEEHRALAQMRLLLNPGGVMSFAEPNMLNPQVFLERHARQWFHYVSPDETAFVRWKLAHSLRSAGFVDIEITPFDWLHPRTWTPVIPLVETAGRALEHVPGVREFAGSLLITARVSR